MLQRLIVFLTFGSLLSSNVLPASGLSVAMPGPGFSATGGAGFVDGVKVGAGGLFVRTDTSTTVDLTCGMVQMEFGPIVYGAGAGVQWAGYPAATSAQWASTFTQWKNTLSAPGQPYGTINCVRLAIGAAPWLGLTGISDNGSTSASSQYIFVCTDTNGRSVYTAGTSGGSCGSGPGHEVAGSSTTYQTDVKNTITNILGASATLGYPVYVIIVNQWSAPVWNATGQVVLPIDQPAMPSPADIPMWQQLVALYGDDHRIMLEPYNEPFGDNQSTNFSTEAWYLGNGHGTPTTFAFPTTATSPNTPPLNYNYDMGISSGQCIVACTGSSGSPNTAQTASMQQISNAIRTVGGHNIVILGNLIADERPEDNPANGGTEAYTDTYAPGGIQQSAWALHAYGYTGSLTNLTNIQNAGTPFIVTESGSMVGNSGSGGGYVVYRSHHWGWTWCCWANFYGTPLANFYSDIAPSPDDGAYGFSNTFTLSGLNPFKNPNVPVGNTGSNTSQIPTGSNLRPAPPLRHLHNHAAANDDQFHRLMTGTRMY